MPPLVQARTRYSYVVPADSPVLLNVRAVDPAVPTWLQLPDPVRRSIRNWPTPPPLCDHPRSIRLVDTSVAFRLVGALGVASSVVADDVFE